MAKSIKVGSFARGFLSWFSRYSNWVSMINVWYGMCFPCLSLLRLRTPVEYYVPVFFTFCLVELCLVRG